MIGKKHLLKSCHYSLFILILFAGNMGTMIRAQSLTYEIQTIPLKGDFINFSGLGLVRLTAFIVTMVPA
jgi:hypothetical protein